MRNISSTAADKKSVNRQVLAALLTGTLLLFSYTLGGAQDPNDPGQPDTVWVDCGNKAVHDTGGWAAFTIYLKTDNQAGGTDIAAMDLPVYLSSSNPNAGARVDTTVSLAFGQSVFNDSGTILAVDADSVNLNSKLGLGAVTFSTGPLNGTYVLAQVWIRLSDSSTVAIDTTTQGNNQLRLVTSQAVGYVPIWKKATCSVCLHSSPPGDANCSGNISLGDVIYLVNYLFKQWAPPCCYSLGDGNCSGTITLGDAILLVNYIFNKGGPVPQYCP